MNGELQRLAIEGSEYTLCEKSGIEFAEILSGPFYAGQLQKLITPRFRMARHPVTNQQWHRFVQDTEYVATEVDPGHPTYLKHWQRNGEPPNELADHPVTWVSFIDCLHFAKWANAAIPSEWFWEKAARGLDGLLCPWGDDIEIVIPQRLAHVKQSSTAAVGDYSHVVTAFGCEQMIGNVSEFCIRAEEPTGGFLPQPDPDSVSADDLVALRGSCYLRSSLRTLKCSYRRRLSAGRRNSWTGLRLAKMD